MKTAQEIIDDCDELFEREELVRELSEQEQADRNITKLMEEQKNGRNKN